MKSDHETCAIAHPIGTIRSRHCLHWSACSWPKRMLQSTNNWNLVCTSLKLGTSRHYFQGLYLEQAMSQHVWPSGHNGNVGGIWEHLAPHLCTTPSTLEPSTVVIFHIRVASDRPMPLKVSKEILKDVQGQTWNISWSVAFSEWP